VLCGKSRKLAIALKTARAGSTSDIAILQQAVSQPKTVAGVKVHEVRRVACSIHVALTDKGDQSTQVNPSRSDGSGVPCLAIGALLKLGCRVGNTEQFGL
jgi:hypothetical protein